MKDFRVGYLYSLAPIHCGGEGDLGNILDIAREVHTDFPYIPGSSLRGSLRGEMETLGNADAVNSLFGKELEEGTQMGVHQVWFGDARLLWVPMRTLSRNNTSVFTWVSCHTLIRDHALIAGIPPISFPDHPVGSQAGTCSVADATLNVSSFTPQQTQTLNMVGNWPQSLRDGVYPTWQRDRIVLPDSNFQVLMEHSLWTQIRNKIQEQEGSAEVFWTDVCVPRDTILYYPWGYRLSTHNPVKNEYHETLMNILQGLIQIGGQANVGRGWVHSWVGNTSSPTRQPSPATVAVGG